MKDYADILNRLNSIVTPLNKHAPFTNQMLSNYAENIKTNLEQILANTEKGTLEIELASYLAGWKDLSMYTAHTDADIVSLVFTLTELVCEKYNAGLKKNEKPWSALELLFPNLDGKPNTPNFPVLGVIERPVWENEKEWQTLMDAMSASGLPTEENALQLTTEERDQIAIYTQCCNMEKKFASAGQLAIAQTYKFNKEQMEAKDSFALAKEKLEQIERIKRCKQLEKPRRHYFEWQKKIELNEVKVHGDYLIPVVNLPQILKSHIVSARGSLIPVSVLLQDPSLRPYGNKNMYDSKPLSPSEMEDEILRLNEHSPETRELHEKETHLTNLANDQVNLLTYLKRLCKHLRFNDLNSDFGSEETAGDYVYEHIRKFNKFYQTLGYQLKKYDSNQEIEEGFVYLEVVFNQDTQVFQVNYMVKSGDKYVKDSLDQTTLPQLIEAIKRRNQINKVLIAAGKEPNVISSKELFEDLHDLKNDILKAISQKHGLSLKEEKNEIPKGVKEEIELLLELSVNPQSNWDRVKVMETCIATRRKNLEKAICGNEEKLISIGCISKNKKSLLQSAAVAVIKEKAVLEQSLKTGKYQGKDRFKLSRTLLDKLNLSLQFRDEDDLDRFMQLTAEDMHVVAAKDENNAAALAALIIMESFALFILRCSSEKLEAILDITMSHLIREGAFEFDPLHAGKSFEPILQYIDDDKKRQVLKKALYSDPITGQLLFTELRGDAQKFHELFDSLSQKQRCMLLKDPYYLLTSLRYCPELIKMLLEGIPKEFRLQAVTCGGGKNTVLHFENIPPEAIQVLLDALSLDERLQAITIKNAKGQTPVHFAAHDPVSLEVLFKAVRPEDIDSIIDEKDCDGKNILHYAAPNAKSLALIFSSTNPDLIINQTDGNGKNILHYTAPFSASLEFILSKMGDEYRSQMIKQRDKFGKTVLHYALDYPPAVLDLLIKGVPSDERWEMMNQTDASGNTLLSLLQDRPGYLELAFKSLPTDVLTQEEVGASVKQYLPLRTNKEILQRLYGDEFPKMSNRLWVPPIPTTRFFQPTEPMSQMHLPQRPEQKNADPTKSCGCNIF